MTPLQTETSIWELRGPAMQGSDNRGKWETHRMQRHQGGNYDGRYRRIGDHCDSMKAVIAS